MIGLLFVEAQKICRIVGENTLLRRASMGKMDVIRRTTQGWRHLCRNLYTMTGFDKQLPQAMGKGTIIQVNG